MLHSFILSCVRWKRHNYKLVKPTDVWQTAERADWEVGPIGGWIPTEQSWSTELIVPDPSDRAADLREELAQNADIAHSCGPPDEPIQHFLHRNLDFYYTIWRPGAWTTKQWTSTGQPWPTEMLVCASSWKVDWEIVDATKVVGKDGRSACVLGVP